MHVPIPGEASVNNSPTEHTLSQSRNAGQAERFLFSNRHVDNEPRTGSQRSIQFERFVDADVAADFLSVKRKTILDWARAGVVPAHPFGRGKRVVWRFRISEIASHNKRVQGTMDSAVPR